MDLRELNPAVKGLAVILCVLLLSFALNPVTPLLTLAATVIVTWSFGRVSWGRWLLLFAPFLLAACSYMAATVLFPRESMAPSPVLLQLGGFEVTRAAAELAASLGLRVLAFSALSLLFILTTDPTRLMLSLMQQCRMPPKLAYGILAGYQFLPLMQEEFRILRTAQRVRDGGFRRSRNPLLQLHRTAIPLLAGAIRKAERVSAAMVSKGFTDSPYRTFYKRVRVTAADWLFLALMVGIVLLSYLAAWRLGYTRLYNGEL
ncbi:putative HMP/thiamine permease protein YkoC [Paenibacillus sp. J31TS4]|uniref:energy-coupling factor transporter transmembrane component T family protein n=1 Tax=Paenibacillus sp. J31TS4 TaxID=2807195 RepID=UPI001B15F2A1|nr:energy-coupling factor transporter transmembrane component T [Paenibacillus sp. J31TS4]GIP40431.1 putative HMP/thiamine permease protein YkoC [Paenibacillus sp. J31TS4]